MSVTLNTNTMKYRETPSDNWVPLVVHADAEVDAVVQDTEPQGSENVWFDTSDSSEVQVPTWDEFNDLKDSFLTQDITSQATLDASIPATITVSNFSMYRSGNVVEFYIEVQTNASYVSGKYVLYTGMPTPKFRGYSVIGADLESTSRAGELFLDTTGELSIWFGSIQKSTHYCFHHTYVI